MDNQLNYLLLICLYTTLTSILFIKAPKNQSDTIYQAEISDDLQKSLNYPLKQIIMITSDSFTGNVMPETWMWKT